MGLGWHLPIHGLCAPLHGLGATILLPHGLACQVSIGIIWPWPTICLYYAFMDANMLTVDQAADKLGVSPSRVRQLLRSGELSGIAPSDWLVSEASLASYKPAKRGWKLGKPRSRKNDQDAPQVIVEASKPIPEQTAYLPTDHIPDFLDPSSAPMID